MGKRRKGLFKHARPPEEHVFEPVPCALDVRLMRGFLPLRHKDRPHKTARERQHQWGKRAVQELPMTGALDPSPRCIPSAWGWNASARCGHLTAPSSHEPSQIQRCSPHSFVRVSAGKSHSLLVSSRGNVFSLGSGQLGQLGIGNAFNDEFLPSRTLQQASPRQVSPTGFVFRGRDLRFSEVACGASFSLARELHGEEAIDLVVGLRQLEQALDRLCSEDPSCGLIAHCRSLLRQERCLALQSAEGRVVAFGLGLTGQLGLGRSALFSTSPVLVPALLRVCIVRIASGAEHSLAVDADGNLYSWGSNRHGKLGLQDLEHRFEPARVRYLVDFYVTECAAGDNHSAVVMRKRGGEGDRASCFGRGAHGRLGDGGTSSSATPVLVRVCMPSLEGAAYRAVACGGAHTLLLVHRPVPATPSSPAGVVAQVVAWGFGTNGQLGDGKAAHSRRPVKVLFPKGAMVQGISAGKSFSLATTVDGHVYSWGTGLRGQLGLGVTPNLPNAPKLPNASRVVAVVPRLVRSAASLVSAGHAHSTAVTVTAAAPRAAPLPSLPPLPSLERTLCVCAVVLGCPRRYPSLTRRSLRFTCRSCGVARLCFDCMKLCHLGHDMIEVTMDSSVPRASFCECGVSGGCRLLCVIDEEDEYTAIHTCAARVIQRTARRHLKARDERCRLLARRRGRFQGVVDFWASEVMAVVWSKVRAATEARGEALERGAMAEEERAKRLFDYYLRQQRLVVRMNALLFGVRRLVASVAVAPDPSAHGYGADYREASTFALSQHSVRHQQLRLHPSRRHSPAALARATEHVPQFDRREDAFFDCDAGLVYARFVRGRRALRWLASVEAERDRRAQAKGAAARAYAVARREARAAKARLLRRALALRDGRAGEEEEEEGRVEDAARESSEQRRAARQRAHMLAEGLVGGREFDALRSCAVPLRRRHSIADPSGMYARVAHLRVDLALKAFSKRTCSLLARIDVLHQPRGAEDQWSQQASASVLRSLDVFSARYGQIVEISDDKFAYLWERIDVGAKRARMRYVSSLAWLSPRLPLDVIAMAAEDPPITPITPNDPIAPITPIAPARPHRRRRRSIADPERLAKQLQIMFLMRNQLGVLRRRVLQESGGVLRRRSFDYGETRDFDQGTLQRLGYVLECPLSGHVSVGELAAASIALQQRMRSRWGETHLQEERLRATALLPANYFDWAQHDALDD